MNSKKPSDRITNLISSSSRDKKESKVSSHVVSNFTFTSSSLPSFTVKQLSGSEAEALIEEMMPPEPNPKYNLPYVLKKGCKFVLYGKNGFSSSTISSDKPGMSSKDILESNDIRVVIEDCKIIENENNIPVYEE